MGLLTGRFTARRFLIDGEIPSDPWGRYAECLQETAFREPMEVQVPPEESIGWTRHDNPMDATFDDHDAWRFDPLVLLALRIDTGRVPKKLLAAKVKQRAFAWCEDNGAERCPASILTQLREDEKDRLMRRALPRIAMHEVLWSTEGRYAIFSSTSDAVCDLFRKRFFSTLGLKPIPVNPTEHWLDEELANRLLETATVLAPMEFLTWFWWHTEERGHWHLDLRFTGTVEVDGWVDNRVALANLATRDKAVLSGENPSVAPEARAALAGGKHTTELAIGLRADSHEFALTLKGPLLDIHNARFPATTADEDGAAIYDRAYLYEMLYDIVIRLYRLYAEARTAPTWETEVLPEMREWMEAPPEEAP